MTTIAHVARRSEFFNFTNDPRGGLESKVNNDEAHFWV